MGGRMTEARVQTSLSTAADALHGEEVAGTGAFVQLGWIAAVGVAIATALVPGDPRIAKALYAVLAVGVVGSVWVYRQLGDRTRYRASMTGMIAAAAIVCGQLGILYVGI